AVAAAARRIDAHAVAGRERDVLLLRQVRWHVLLTPAIDADAVHAAVLAAERAERSGAAVVHDEGGAGVAAQQFDLVGKAEAAAMLPRAAGPIMQRVVPVENRIGLLHHLDRRRLRDADG